MEILLHTPLDNRIVTLLLNQGGQSVSELYHRLSSPETPVTLQAIYKRIRYLTAAGVILKNKQSITINSEWSEGVLALLGNFSGSPTVQQNESITYSFKGLEKLDAYWKHIMLPLEKKHTGYPVFFYNPHEVWINLDKRKDSEKKYLENFTKNQRYCFYLLGKQNKFNSAFKQVYQTSYLQVSIGERRFSDRDYIAVISDYIITTRLSLKLTNLIDKIYMGPEMKQKDMSILFSKREGIKLKIERNGNKAKRIRKIISKDFYISKELKEKYNLF